MSLTNYCPWCKLSIEIREHELEWIICPNCGRGEGMVKVWDDKQRDSLPGAWKLDEYFRCWCGISGVHTAHATQISMFDDAMPEKPRRN